MHAPVVFPLAAAEGFPLLGLFWVLLGVSAFVCGVAGVGRLLAATHPAKKAAVPPPATVAAPTPAPAKVNAAVPVAGNDPALAVAIAAAVHALLGDDVRIKSVTYVENPKVNVEGLMLAWSVEGRREIYYSHRVR